MPRSAVTPRQLRGGVRGQTTTTPGGAAGGKIEGLNEVLDEISRRLRGSQEVGRKLKNVYLAAAQPLVEKIKGNIANLPIDQSAKTVLRGQVVAGRGPLRHPNAFVAMYQWAVNIAARKAEGGRVPNPAWFEYGTVERVTKSGHKTGKMTATPFFRPAIVQARPEVKQRLVEGLKEVLVEGK